MDSSWSGCPKWAGSLRPLADSSTNDLMALALGLKAGVGHAGAVREVSIVTLSLGRVLLMARGMQVGIA
jgi:hypothetical protein